jgi:hypothetical protein
VRKGWVVFKREFLQTTRKKSFWILTLLMPFLMGALLALPALIAERGLSAKRIAVLDATGRLAASFDEKAMKASLGEALQGERGPLRSPEQMPTLIRAEYAAVQGDPSRASEPYLARLKPGRPDHLDGVVLVPADVFENERARVVYYGRSAADLIGPREVGRIVSQAVSRQRLLDRGIDPAFIDTVMRRVPVESMQVSSTGQKK